MKRTNARKWFSRTVHARGTPLWLKFTLIFTLLLLFTLELVGALFATNLKAFYVGRLDDAVRVEGEFLAFYLAPYLSAEFPAREDVLLEDIETIVRNFIPLTSGRVYVVDNRGFVVASVPSDARVVGHKLRHEGVERALEGVATVGPFVRGEEGEVFRVAAFPVRDRGNVVGAVVMDVPAAETFRLIADLRRLFFTSGAIALGVSALVVLFFARGISAPIVALTAEAEALSRGEFPSRRPSEEADELGRLDRAFVRMAEALRDALHTLEAERHRLAAVVAHMAEGILAADDRGRVYAANAVALELLGVSQAEERTLQELFALPSDEDLGNLFSEAGAFLLERGNRNLRIKTNPLPDGGVVVAVTDVTEEMRREARQKEFVAHVSHELRTPLTAIRAYLEAAEEEELPPNARHFLAVALREARRMERLIADLLTLSRIDAGEMTLHLAPTDVRLWIAEVVERFAMRFRQKDVEFTYHLPERQLCAFLDVERMNRVLDNLLDNALQFTPSQGKVSLKVGEEGGRLRISVSDTGVGIPAADLPYVFERFYRVDRSRSRSPGGTGLGLAISREIARLHGGDISIHSKEGAGTTVTLYLPGGGDCAR